MTGWTGKIVRSLLIVSVLIMPLALVPGALAEEDDGVWYTVKKGDTLWSITQKEFKDPFLWPKLWQVNPKLGNPHLIYPGNRINLEELRKALMEEAVVIEKEVKEVVVEPPAPPPVLEVPKEATSLRYGAIGEVGFISPDHVKGAGTIFGVRDDKIMVSDGDEVFVEFASGTAATLGDVFTVIRETATVFHPITGDRVGFLNEIRGVIEVTDVKSDYYVCRVVKSYKSMEKADVLVGHKEKNSLIEFTEGPRDAKGHVIRLDKDALQGAEFRIVFLDLGAKDGLSVGNWMEIYKVPRATRILKGDETEELAPQVLGDMLVVSVENDTSAAVVHKSTEAFEVGDFVRTKLR